MKKGQIPLHGSFFLGTFSLASPGLNMADAANKYPENVPGNFCVDDQGVD